MPDNFNQITQRPESPKVLRALVFYIFGFGLLLAADQLTKFLAAGRPSLGSAGPPAFMGIRYFRNYEFAFSLPVPVWLMYALYFAVLAGMIYFVWRHHRNFNRLAAWAWLLIFAGAAGNIGERLVLGYVRDFIAISLFGWIGIYNLADGFILLGLILLLMQNHPGMLPGIKPGTPGRT